jgi:hypothetical protein
MLNDARIRRLSREAGEVPESIGIQKSTLNLAIIIITVSAGVALAGHLPGKSPGGSQRAQDAYLASIHAVPSTAERQAAIKSDSKPDPQTQKTVGDDAGGNVVDLTY